jgi:hypothetical protein
MAAVDNGGRHGRGVFFLPSFRLANLVPGYLTTPKPPKNQPLSDLISPPIMVGCGRFKYPSCAYSWLEDVSAV